MGRTLATLTLLVGFGFLLAAAAASEQSHLEESILHDDASEEPEKQECDLFRNMTTSIDKCHHIQKYCEDEGLWKPLEVYYCTAVPNGWGVPLIILSVVWLYILFLVLGATADNFFSPILTQLSQDLGLPPRFAGVTFLALGNGAPDVSSTIMAVKGGDYNLSLGSLTGAGMFVGTVVAGACILTAGGAKCRGALIRDVLGYAVAVISVLCVLAGGQVGMLQVGILFSMYLCFVAMVLGADLWHRLVHLKRFPQEASSPRRTPGGLSSEVEISPSRAAASSPDYAHMPANRYRDLAWATLSRSASFFKRVPSLKGIRENLFRQGALSGSFMRQESSAADFGARSSVVYGIAEDHEAEQEEVAEAQVEVRERLLNGDSSDDDDDNCAANGASELYVAPPLGANGDEESGSLQAPQATLNLMQRSKGSSNDSETPSLTSTRRPPDWAQGVDEDGPMQATWSDLVATEDDGQETVWARAPSLGSRVLGGVTGTTRDMWNGLFMESWDEIEEMSLYDKSSVLLLSPFTLMQRATIPIMVPENYCKPWLVLSIVLCPVWLMYYTGNWGSSTEVWLIVMGTAVGGAGLAAATSERDVPPDWSCGTRILIGAALMCVVGFVVAASWIALVADQLVSMIQFFGLLSGLDSAVLGLTVLAWGNSLGDLSTNVAMAKRGLSNMALTACFAGPLFNILVGISVGFALWLREEGVQAVPVQMNFSVLLGGLFIIGNCTALVALGLLNGKRVPRNIAFIMFGVYGIYVTTSLTMLVLS